MKTPKKIRKSFEIKGGFTQKDLVGVIIGIGIGCITSLPMLPPLRLAWIIGSAFISIWLMLPNRKVHLKHWQVLFLILTRPVHTYIAERDSRGEQ